MYIHMCGPFSVAICEILKEHATDCWGGRRLVRAAVDEGPLFQLGDLHFFELHLTWPRLVYHEVLVGGFNPSEKYSSVGMIIPNIPNIWENIKCSKPPTRVQ